MFTLHKGDCLQVMPTIPSGSIDAIITDLPYGTTACEWDSVIPLAPMWKQVKRVLKSNGAFITTASQPFTSILITSNLEMFKYENIWNKQRGTDWQLENNRPLKAHENIVVFGSGTITYNPQKTKRDKPMDVRNWKFASAHNGEHGSFGSEEHDKKIYYDKFPISVFEMSGQISEVNNTNRTHPTQKPVALYEYLIKTYTNFGETVLDITMGSGTTIIAAMKTGRKSIGIERDPKYFAIAEKRIKQAAQQPALLHEARQSVHLTAFGAGGRGQIPLQSSFIADDSSAKHGGK